MTGGAWNVCLTHVPALGGLYRAIGDFARGLDAPILSFDDGRRDRATLSAAETLAAAGASVDLIATSGTALWSVTLYSRMTALERLTRAGVRLRQSTRLIEIQDERRLLCKLLGTGELATLGPFDRLVHSAQGEAASDAQQRFEQAGLPVRTIGDALAPRRIFDAMHDAQSLIRGLEPDS